jgi:Arc/MetJ-type ribon-helix-helix transcriptional regulator
MTTKSILVQVRMPPRIVQALDRLSVEGIYSNRSEAILDGVRRLVLAFETKDPFRQALLRSYLDKPAQGSIEELRNTLDREDIVLGVKKTFCTDRIEEIIAEVRR